MSSMLDKKAAAIYAVEQLAKLDDCQSITITLQDSSGVFSVVGATLSSDGSEMILRFSIAGPTTFGTLRLSELSER